MQKTLALDIYGRCCLLKLVLCSGQYCYCFAQKRVPLLARYMTIKLLLHRNDILQFQILPKQNIVKLKVIQETSMYTQNSYTLKYIDITLKYLHSINSRYAYYKTILQKIFQWNALISTIALKREQIFLKKSYGESPKY